MKDMVWSQHNQKEINIIVKYDLNILVGWGKKKSYFFFNVGLLPIFLYNANPTMFLQAVSTVQYFIIEKNYINLRYFKY